MDSQSEKQYTVRNWIGLILGPLLFALTFFFIPQDLLAYEPRIVLGVTLLVATYWVTEPVPLPVTSLIPLILIPAFYGVDIETIAPAYTNPVIFMYGGGFVIALAIEKWDLHRRIALNIIKMIGSESNRMILGILIATAGISMFVSNAATALMMLPVAVALINEVRDKSILEGENLKKFSKGILLTVAYSATIGGLATLVAAVPNALLAGIASSQLDREITFAQWLFFAGPLALVMLIILYFYLTKVQFKVDKSDEKSGTMDFIDDELDDLGKFNSDEMKVAAVFLITVSLWILSPFIISIPFIPEPVGIFFEGLHDGTIAIFGAVMLFFLPSSKKGERILAWKDMKELPWGVLLLFGGGMSLAEAFGASGLNESIADVLGLLEGLEYIFILLLLVVFVLSITEILSNTAVSNLVLPLTVGLGIAVGVDPLPLMAGAALAAGSCYMLPVATPPNTAVFSAGYLTVGDMAKAGVWLNIISVIVITLAVYFWMPVIFDF
ncbi:SLC13 family permease [Salinicoccus halitifaciens]|uniref:Sodium-dependent dicarboxylate transporter SdcS n=1 Tax=Salinicoccus halitifaciens TaxID=1073415 RepID=A0ABV2E5M7_9STAP|nr:DASS family sodium-coupled anion symporter [Salinicoccus halitifaciens]MCD2137220.1 DASS family sodium-coupled anion symporter [Salinicoccus halitifaciens]